MALMVVVVHRQSDELEVPRIMRRHPVGCHDFTPVRAMSSKTAVIMLSRAVVEFHKHACPVA